MAMLNNKRVKGQIQVHFPKSDSGTMMSRSQQRSDNQIADFNHGIWGSNVFNPKNNPAYSVDKGEAYPWSMVCNNQHKEFEQETLEYSYHSGNASCSKDFQSRGGVHQSPVGDSISEAQQVVQRVPSIWSKINWLVVSTHRKKYRSLGTIIPIPRLTFIEIHSTPIKVH